MKAEESSFFILGREKERRRSKITSELRFDYY
jgi:hypothetical protein